MEEDWESDYDTDYTDEPDFDEETSTIECPNCGADVYEEAPACPVCGEYIGVDTHPFSERPRWWVSLGILGVIATILTLIFLS
ncbi:zinc ribbon domain-containing protein [Gimesia sp.]|uniref:zinc ribbon domain-containing protein n=1 Tax=Gimesia sp. TaxID=2024833 RepID=UPI003A8DD079